MSRYHRQIIIPNFGAEAQEKLSGASVLIVGAGGLGCPVGMFLAGAGVGHLIVMDDDRVELTNLHRQIAFTEADIGKNKAICLQEKLSQMNSEIKITAQPLAIDKVNALEAIKEVDVVVDCTDNFPTRYLINDAAVLTDRPVVFGSVHQWEGQVAVFNAQCKDSGRSSNYRDVHFEQPSDEEIPSCAEGGALGTVVGVIGTLQATECIKIITGVGEVLKDRLLMLDGRSMDMVKMKIKKNPKNIIEKLRNYQQFCKNENNQSMSEVKEISVSQLKEWKDAGKEFQLIDVRESHEYDFVNLGGELIPLGAIMQNRDKLDLTKDIVFQCRTGGRSKSAILQLGTIMDTSSFYNLKGGIIAYAKEIDKSLPTY